MRLTLDDLKVAEATARNYPHTGGWAGWRHWFPLGIDDYSEKIPCNCIVGSLAEFNGESLTEGAYLIATYLEITDLLRYMGRPFLNLTDPTHIREAAPYLKAIIDAAEGRNIIPEPKKEMTNESESPILVAEAVC